MPQEGQREPLWKPLADLTGFQAESHSAHPSNCVPFRPKFQDTRRIGGDFLSLAPLYRHTTVPAWCSDAGTPVSDKKSATPQTLTALTMDSRQHQQVLERKQERHQVRHR